MSRLKTSLPEFRVAAVKVIARDWQSGGKVQRLGMGGSRLCPEVRGTTFGQSPFPALDALDLSDPVQVKPARSAG